MSYFKQSSQEVNKVYKTNDLSIFNQIKGNRPPNIQHIRRLSDSIKTNGTLQNPIIVNEKMYVIDGQHRLLAAKEVGACVYYIIVEGYELSEVQVLNLNQKNWTKKDFMMGYADMGIEPYVKLRDFYLKNKSFNLSDCIAMCHNSTTSSSVTMSQKYRHDHKIVQQKEVFEEGTWVGKNFDLAQDYADKLKMIGTLYSGYNRSVFVSVMIGMFKKEQFIFSDFLNKLKNQSVKMIDCSNTQQYKLLIEDIYNYRRRNKVNLRY